MDIIHWKNNNIVRFYRTMFDHRQNKKNKNEKLNNNYTPGFLPKSISLYVKATQIEMINMM